MSSVDMKRRNNPDKYIYEDDNLTEPVVRHKRDENREIGFITYIFVAVFLLMIGYLCYYTFFISGDLINNPYNKRQQLLEERIIRGDILSRTGEVLAKTTIDGDGKSVRMYPYQNVFSHVVGYSTHGVLGIERIENFKMLESNDNIFKKIENDLSGERNVGNTIVTTLDEKLQRAAYDGMGDKRGAVVAMNAKTGEILALVSKPDFDPNKISYNYDNYNEDTINSPLLNRAVLGLYPPGSTFKIVTALEYIDNNSDLSDYNFNCSGGFSINGTTINCYHGQQHGEVDFEMSFAKSCNSSFANLTSDFSGKEFEDLCKRLMFGENLPFPFTTKVSVTSLSSNVSFDELLQTGIGQGQTLITPVHMALITAAIANDGILMEPYIVSRIESANKRVVEKNEAKEYKRLISRSDASILYSMMRKVVTDGTGTRALNTKGYIIGGKTGSAEFMADKSRSHAWFTGYGSSNDDCIVVTVIVEDGGSGGEVAVPIAKSVFDAYYE